MAVNPVYHQTSDILQEELSWISSAKKDPERFGPLYKKYHEQIFRYVYQRMDDQDLAFDVTSQVFIKAMNNLHKFEYRGVPFSSWLYRIAKSESSSNKPVKNTSLMDIMERRKYFRQE